MSTDLAYNRGVERREPQAPVVGILLSTSFRNDGMLLVKCKPFRRFKIPSLPEYNNSLG